VALACAPPPLNFKERWFLLQWKENCAESRMSSGVLQTLLISERKKHPKKEVKIQLKRKGCHSADALLRKQQRALVLFERFIPPWQVRHT